MLEYKDKLIDTSFFMKNPPLFFSYTSDYNIEWLEDVIALINYMSFDEEKPRGFDKNFSTRRDVMYFQTEINKTYHSMIKIDGIIGFETLYWLRRFIDESNIAYSKLMKDKRNREIIDGWAEESKRSREAYEIRDSW